MAVAVPYDTAMTPLSRLSRHPRLRQGVRRLSEVMPIGGRTLRRLARAADGSVRGINVLIATDLLGKLTNRNDREVVGEF